MEDQSLLLITGGVVVFIVVILYLFYVWRSRQIELTDTQSPDEKPEWMHTTPPQESQIATQAQGGIGIYGQETNEKLAAPFAEQIEDILRQRLHSDSALSTLNVDLGTSATGDLEIWVDGQCYTAIDNLPNERLRQAFREAIDKWERSQ